MGNCKDCEHWTPPHGHASGWSDNLNYAGFGGCERTAVEGGARGTEHLALAYGNDGVFAILATKPEFGCVLWEKKDG